MHRNRFVSGVGVALAALVSSGFAPADMTAPDGFVIRIQATAPAAPVPTGATPPSEAPAAEPVPERPLTPEEMKAAETRLAFDRLLVDAAVLRTNLENYRRGKSKTPVSLSAFRSLEIRLKEIADADPANTQALDMSNAMKMAQFEILQPSVEIAAGASRQLYAHAMADQLKDDGVSVVVSGPGSRIVRFSSPNMVREMALKLSESARIIEQAKMLEFSRVVFTNGRRYWSYDVARGRFR